MTTIYGYARVSTPKQDINRQIRNIRAEFPDAHIVSEAYTGTKIDRPEFSKLLRTVRSGDSIIFDEVSRMARNAAEGFDLYQQLYRKGVRLIFLKEPHLNTDVYHESLENGLQATGNDIADIYIEATNKVLMLLAEKQIRTAFDKAQQEVDYLHQRTREGIEAARLSGKQIGQVPGAKLITKKSIAAKAMIRKYNRDFEGSLNDADCIRLIGCARGSYYKYKREIKVQFQE